MGGSNLETGRERERDRRVHIERSRMWGEGEKLWSFNCRQRML